MYIYLFPLIGVIVGLFLYHFNSKINHIDRSYSDYFKCSILLYISCLTLLYIYNISSFDESIPSTLPASDTLSENDIFNTGLPAF